MKKLIFTSSWDDGHQSNLKLLDLLNRYGLKGTFYIQGEAANRLEGKNEIRQIAKTQEVGAHTFSHPKLTRINQLHVKEEIIKGKEILEQILGQPVPMFSYPYGLFNGDIKNEVKKAGFLGARTTNKFIFDLPVDFFEFAITLQIYPHPFRKRDAKHLHGPRVVLQPLQNNFKTILKLKLPPSSFFSWLSLAKNLFNYVNSNGQIFHLFGHAYEIERYGMWSDLEEFFKYVTANKDIIYLTNTEVLKNNKND